MSMGDNLPKYFVLVFLAAGLGLGVWQFAGPGGSTTRYTVDVKVLKLSAAGTTGKTDFDTNCAACHGVNAAGTDAGPPLVHDIYNPGHHSDDSFFIAAKLGVPQHHWRYGAMPPLPHVTKRQLTAIVQYVRELQTTNGIGYRPHRM